MFAKKTLIRLAACMFVGAAWLPTGNGPLQPASANAGVWARWYYPRPVVRVAPVAPVVTVARAATVVRTGPVYTRPYYRGWSYRRWYHW